MRAAESSRSPSAEQNDEWSDGRRYLGLDILAKSRLVLITTTDHTKEEQALGAISAQARQ